MQIAEILLYSEETKPLNNTFV